MAAQATLTLSFDERRHDRLQPAGHSIHHLAGRLFEGVRPGGRAGPDARISDEPSHVLDVGGREWLPPVAGCVRSMQGGLLLQDLRLTLIAKAGQGRAAVTASRTPAAPP